MDRFTLAATVLLLSFPALAVLACSSGGDPGPDGAVGGKLAAPAEATATATPRPKTVVLDPGHGGPEVGAAANGVVEKDSNLELALRVERLLRARGFAVVLTRRSDARAATPPAGPATGFGATRADLQARIDLANAEEADLFISIHSNGASDTSERGVEVWYDPNRPFAGENRRLASLLLERVVAELGSYGYQAFGRGMKDDSCFRFRFGRCFPLYLLGPEREITRAELARRGIDPGALGLRPDQQSTRTRASAMPGALAELLFVTNEADAAVLRDEAGREALARGIAAAAAEFLAGS